MSKDLSLAVVTIQAICATGMVKYTPTINLTVWDHFLRQRLAGLLLNGSYCWIRNGVGM